MSQRNTPSRTLLCFSLALVLTGIAGCSGSSEGEPGQEGQTAAGEAQPGSAAPGQPPAGTGAADVPQAGTPEAAKPVKPEEIPAVVARVNGEEIRKEQLLSQADRMRQELARMGRGQAPLNSTFYRDVLDTLVAQALLRQEARTEGITVTDAEVDQQIQALRSRFPTAEDFQKALASQGMSEEKLRQEIRRDGVVQKLLETRVAANVTVSDQAAREFYDKNQEKMKQPERVRVRHILVQVDQNAAEADKQKARAEAEDVLKRAKAGEDFAKLASEHSDDPGSKVQGGELPWLVPGQTVPPFEKAAFALTKPDELSPVVETQFGYHVIQFIEHQAGSVIPFEQVKGRIGQFLREQGIRQKLQAHVQELKTKGKVETFL